MKCLPITTLLFVMSVFLFSCSDFQSPINPNHDIDMVAARKRVASPTFTPGGGTYPNAISVKLNCATNRATIRYTTDGSKPTNKSPKYNSPISVSKNMTIRAFATKKKMRASNRVQAQYKIGGTVPTKELVAEYLFNGTSATKAKDTGPYNLDGVIHGGAQRVAGKYGNALEFDSNDDYVMVGDHDPLDVGYFTMMAWVYPYDYSDPKRLEVLEKTAAYWMNLRKDETPIGIGRAGFFGPDQNGSRQRRVVDTPDPVPLNTWTHMASTYDGMNLKIYLDGVLINTTKAYDKDTPAKPNQYNLTLGCKETFEGDIVAQWSGKLDEIRIFNYALTRSEIVTYMNKQ